MWFNCNNTVSFKRVIVNKSVEKANLKARNSTLCLKVVIKWPDSYHNVENKWIFVRLVKVLVTSLGQLAPKLFQKELKNNIYLKNKRN